MPPHQASCLTGISTTPGTHHGYALNALGIALGCIGSLSINLGNNLQAKGLQTKQSSSDGGGGDKTLWAIGTAVFVMATLINFTAFGFAPASVVAPLESLQFVANLFFAKFVNKKTLTWRMLIGTAMILVGTVITVIFGPIDGTLIVSLDSLVAYWDAPGWLAYLAIVICIAGIAELTHGFYSHAQRRGESLPGQAAILPMSFATGTALLASQAVVQSKCFAEVVKLFAAGCAVELFESWYLYVTILIMASTGILYVFRLNKALGMYDPLFIIPLLQSQYILCATLSGGIYFQEFSRLTTTKVRPSSLASSAPHTVPHRTYPTRICHCACARSLLTFSAHRCGVCALLSGALVQVVFFALGIVTLLSGVMMMMNAGADSAGGEDAALTAQSADARELQGVSIELELPPRTPTSGGGGAKRTSDIGGVKRLSEVSPALVERHSDERHASGGSGGGGGVGQAESREKRTSQVI